MKKRGRKTKLDVKLQKEICGYLSDCCTIRTACEATGISETAFFEWIRRGEAGEQQFAQFAQAVTRARGRAKAQIVRSLLDEKDWRARLELLARVFPDEYGRREPVPPPPAPPPPPPDLSRKIKVGIHGLPGFDLGEFLRMKGELQAAGIKTDFPVIDTAPASQVVTDDDDDDVGNIEQTPAQS
jgi:hypothetical protein